MDELVDVPRAFPLSAEAVERTIFAWLGRPRLVAATLVSFSFDSDVNWLSPREGETRVVDSIERAARTADVTLVISSEVALAVGRRGDRIRQSFLRLDRAGVRVLRHQTLHGKVYLFEEEARRCWIVGSSNLSLGGLRLNEEVNLRGYHPEDYAGVAAMADRIVADAAPYWT